jgi:O-antigen ligase
VNEFRDHPVGGIGYESFQVPYLVHRRTDETPRYTRSLAFGILSQLGLVGVALFLASSPKRWRRFAAPLATAASSAPS